jgi:hypothetical protein
MAADLYRVNISGLGTIWKQISATWRERSQGREPPSAEIRTLIMLREVELWLALPDHDHLARDYRNQPLGVVLVWVEGKRLLAHMVAGRKLSTWIRPAIDTLKKYRDSLGLDALDIYIRLRWRPYLTLAGAESTGVIIHAQDGIKILPVLKQSA